MCVSRANLANSTWTRDIFWPVSSTNISKVKTQVQKVEPKTLTVFHFCTFTQFCPAYLSSLSRIISCNVIYVFVYTSFCLNPSECHI